MKYFALLLTLVSVVSAQVPAYGQCGGDGWTGATACASGSACVVQNPYYSQCVPGASGGNGGGTTTASSPPSGTKTSSSSSPTSTSSINTTPQCGDYDVVEVGSYSLLTDLWGASGATSGNQCSTLVNLSGSTISWVTNWTWTGGTGVKSFSNIQLDDGINVQLSAITSMESKWDWSQDATGTVVADVAYDLFTSNTAGGSNVNEIMVWLANFNAGPISANYSSSGQPVPKASNLSIAGETWDLYSGSNGSNNVYSFLPASGGTITSFSGDINLFLQYLTTNEGVSTSQYLITAQAGTEATSGTATLTTSAYSLVIA